MKTLPYEPIGVIKTARQDYTCMGCGGTIKKGTKYDYSDGWSATYHDDDGYKTRKYYQFRVHYPGECEEPPVTNVNDCIDLLDF